MQTTKAQSKTLWLNGRKLVLSACRSGWTFSVDGSKPSRQFSSRELATREALKAVVR